MKEVYNYLKGLLKDGDVIVIGCSGGPDSMALLSLLIKLKQEKSLFVVCAHVNHNVRRASAKEQIFVEDYCKKNDIIFETMTITKYSDDNFENEARTIRYKYFDDLIMKYNGNYLMTAHHGDDLIETILMRIVRGSTLNGYSGFSRIINYDNYKIVRPLITMTKKQLIKYDEKNKISYVTDLTNFDDFHTRNRYRKYVLPFLKKEDPKVHEKFLKYSVTLQMYDEFINKEMLKKLDNVYTNNVINIEKFRQLDKVIQIKIINYILAKEYTDDLVLISDVHVNLILDLINSNRSNSYIYLPNNIKAIKSYAEFKIEKETDSIDSYEIEISNYAHLPNGKNIEVISETDCNSNYYCRLLSTDGDIIFPLHVRTRKSGDKMFVKGMKKEKKVKDIFINSKIPIRERDLWPIVVDSKDKIVWIPGIKKSKFDIPKNKNCDIILRYY